MTVKNCFRKLWHVILITPMMVGLGGCSSDSTGPQDGEEDPASTAMINTQNVVSANFAGNGVQWSAYPHGDSESSQWGKLMTQDQWEKVYRRLDFMKPQIIRVMINGGWRYFQGLDQNGRPIVDMQDELEPLEKLLTYCQENDVQVMFGEWGPPGGIDSADDERWIEIATDYLQFLVQEKGYTCIEYYNLVNEPNGDWSATEGDWDEWKNAVQMFQEKLEEKNLDDQVRLAGPDAVASYDNSQSQYTGKGWVQQTAQQLDSITGLYEMHDYPGQQFVRSGDFSNYYSDLVPQINNMTNKPLIFGEIGFKYDRNRDSELYQENRERATDDGHASVDDSNMFVYDFFYGVDMADALIQSMIVGADGMVAWSLDDAMHTGNDRGDPDNLKRWGMWNILGEELHGNPEDEEIRPWYYPWSLMTRYFPEGSNILETQQLDKKGLRIIAAEYQGEYTIAVVNSAHPEYEITLKTDQAVEKTFSRYVYTQEERPKESGGDFPVPKEQVEDVNLEEGMDVSVPGLSFQLYTSQSTPQF